MISRIPTYLMLGILAGWLNRQQQAVIDYLRAENEILKRQLKGRRPRLTDDERRRLAVKGKALGRMVLTEIACIVTPETILGWHRRLVALKWTFPHRSVGRPPVAHEVRALIVEMARTEFRWGYTSIRERSAPQSWASGKPSDRGERAERVWPGAGAEAKSRNLVVDILESALGRTGGDRFHHG
jgi:hypothetical protein